MKPIENYPVSLPASNSGANAAEGLHCKVSSQASVTMLWFHRWFKALTFSMPRNVWRSPRTIEKVGHVFTHHPQKGHQQNCQEDEDWQFDIFYWWPKSSFQVLQVGFWSGIATYIPMLTPSSVCQLPQRIMTFLVGHLEVSLHLGSIPKYRLQTLKMKLVDNTGTPATIWVWLEFRGNEFRTIWGLCINL